eukprot:TRINITY_DN4067_c0_g1_i1.p1 TRINITY_DN4067_c0_g1~~TRINITY_DN4067_c0_g1_i1.p1  ORF type:complete len:400 (+),score=74.65 TRINITY_DN4067_c0_g1_i1:66-1265(+)
MFKRMLLDSVEMVSTGPVAVAVVAAVTFACVLNKFRRGHRYKAGPRISLSSPGFPEPMDEEQFRSSVLSKKVSLDLASSRRKVRNAFIQIQQNLDHPLFKMPNDGIESEEKYEKNSRGIEIFSKTWLPMSGMVKGIVCFCHGYGDTCTFFFEGIARKLAASGYAVFAMDYPGFGLSEGLHGYIPSFENLVDDVIEHYSKIRGKPEYKDLPCFLYGQSLGGAVALKIVLKQPNAWNGAVLNAPMCKIADNITPPWPVVQFLLVVACLLPKQKWVPYQDLAELAFRESQKREMTKYNVIAYHDPPRLRTAAEMLKTTMEIEKQMHKVSLPLLIVHGAADMVTDPSVSNALYERCSSTDKKLIMYDNAYHAILEGEPDETIFEVLDNVVSWLDEHSAAAPKD